MSSTTIPQTKAVSESSFNPLTENLSSLVCEAGVELDNLLTGYGNSVRAISDLADVLRDPKSALDFRGGVVTKWAISDSLREDEWARTRFQVEDMNETGEDDPELWQRIATAFSAIADNPQYASSQPQELKELRDFCVSLFNSISTREHWSQGVRLHHPWRR
jgi:hypothetical protein